MKTLTLTIAEPWFSMIRDGKKKEEYREIKPYYKSRLQGSFYFKKFEKLVLRNGYRPDSPTITLKNPRIRIGTGRPEWGAVPGKQYFVITFGERAIDRSSPTTAGSSGGAKSPNRRRTDPKRNKKNPRRVWRGFFGW